MRTHHFLHLDDLRGVAAIAVALGHASGIFNAPHHFDNTALAVDFFFILSGFVLDHAYGPRLRNKGSFLPYLKLRVIRLYPLVVLGSILGMGAALLAGSAAGSTLPLVILGALLVPVRGETCFPLNPPTWSLFYEMAASLLFGLGVWQQWRLRTLAAAVFLFAAALAVATVHNGTLDSGWAVQTVHYGAVRTGFGFGTGILLHRLFQAGIRVPALPVPILSILLLAVLLLPASVPLQLLSTLLLFPAIVMSGASADAPTARAASLSGALSYPIYILHVPIMHGLSALLVDPRMAALAAVPTVLGGAYAALKLYDEPIRRWLRRKSRDQEQGSSAGAGIEAGSMPGAE